MIAWTGLQVNLRVSGRHAASNSVHDVALSGLIDRGVSDLSAQGSRACYRKLYGQLVSNAPFPAP
jgi:hypothetical protein